VVAALTLTLTVACSSSSPGPTTAQAGAQLRADMTRSLKVFQSLDDDPSAFTVNPDGTQDIPCGKGRARRTYTAERSTGGKGITNPPYVANEVNLLKSWLSKYSGYSIAKTRPSEADDPLVLTYPMANDDHHAEALITAKAVKGRLVLILSAATACLPAR
jgi:hypothetical protein